MKNRIVCVIIFLCFLSQLYPVMGQRCSTTADWHQNRIQNDPDYSRFVRDWQLQILEMKRLRELGRSPNCSAGPVKIPIAVHFDSGTNMPTTAAEQACAINLALDQISTLNNELNGLDPQNTAFAPIASCFGTSIGNSGIEFCLAQYGHPAGYSLVDGDFAVTFGQVNFSNLSSPGSSVPTDPNWAGYLNIFVDQLGGGLLGEASGIPGDFSGEGVIVNGCNFGTGSFSCTGWSNSSSCAGTLYNEGNTLVHEVGHYLGLPHIWGDGGCGADDGIADTPAMSVDYSGYTACNDSNCAQLPSTCSTDDMYMNYMSYASDACMYMLTSEQADVVHATATAAGFSTAIPLVCTPPTAPIASFSPNGSSISVCTGDPIFINDLSTNGPTSWSWSFSGSSSPSPTSSNIQNPNISFSTSGVLTISLTATNANGSNTATATITVIASNCSNGCVDMSNIDLATDNLILSTASVGGYVAGSNGYGDLSKVEYFDLANEGICYPSELTSVTLCFGKDAAASGNIDVAVWDDAGGSPNAILGSTTVSVASLTDITAGGTIPADCDVISFALNPITLTGPFYVGISGLNGVTSGDIGLVINTDGETTDPTKVAWEQFSDGTWVQFDAASSWQLSVSSAIFPTVLPLSTASFLLPSPSGGFCDDGTAYSFSNTTGALCSGSLATYFWSLYDAAGNTTNTSVATNPSFSFSTAGTYDLELCVTGLSCEQDCISQAITVQSCGASPCPSTLPLTGNVTSVVDNEADDWIESDQNILSGAQVDYDAVNYILLKNGFSVDANANFEAFIDGCDNGGGGIN